MVWVLGRDVGFRNAKCRCGGHALACVVRSWMDLLAALRGEGDLLTEAEAWGGVSRGGRRGTGARHCTGWTAAVPGWSIRALAH